MSADDQTTVIAFVGKGGTGKTALCALTARALLEAGQGPLLLVDADPAGGLVYAVGSEMGPTMADVMQRVVQETRRGAADNRTVAETLDWRVLEVLQERGRYSLLTMGRTDSRGCFCSINKLLRSAIETLATGFRYVLVDAEAGIEQVNRQVLGQVHIPIVISDGSRRGWRTAEQLAGLLGERTLARGPIGCIVNRQPTYGDALPPGLEPWGVVPPDEQLAEADRQGRSLLELPADSSAMVSVGQIVADRILGHSS